MFFSWLQKQRRAQVLAESFPADWLRYLADNVRHYNFLDPPRRMAMRQVVHVLVAEKHWDGGAGLEITEEMKVTVAGQAAVLGLGMQTPYYFDRVQSIILYAGPYRHPPQFQRLFSATGLPLLGEAWHHGPIVLSWKDVLASGHNAADGGNLVFHEFAHHLDDLDGDMEGTPPLVGRERQERWYRVTEAEYLRLLGQARRKEVTLLSHYGASNHSEFFAVATECFFERPHAMRERHAELYAILCDFFCQDPARWLPDANASDESKVQQRADRKDPHTARFRNDRLAVLRSGAADALFTLATDYYHDRRYALAAAACTRAIQLNPQDYEAYEQRASARIQRGCFAAALADCNEALRLEPDEPELYSARGAAYLGLGQCENAKQDLDRAIREGENDARAYYYRGRAWAAMGRPRRAVADFTKSLALRPLTAEVYYHSGLAHHALGNKSQAETELTKAFQLDPLVDRRQ